ncbi:DCAF10 [Cordylochernes scorpioides]|uniref:DCAF10 n=1 Tax=Cordylochernes scorpioides TaxID=51811 RepID=A0ABY6JYP4_9ARAC|nr:DCAF10 [Cordylochernes scorpioides]
MPRFESWQRAAQLGHPRKLGHTDDIKTRLYTHLGPFNSWDPQSYNIDHGGIFNLEFTPDGSLLAATAENSSLLLFDPLNHILVNSVAKAHEDCVNYARFLDTRLLATCSDDTTVALWDVRFLKNKVRTLVGHSNWVKNIEYASEAGLLVTSGFDGSIYTWDINKYTESNVQYQQVLYTKGLMRMRLSPDSSKMIICTLNGYLMVIHDLDFDHLKSDLHGFKPNSYRKIQASNVEWPKLGAYNRLFSARRNRVELIADFPEANEAAVISSLQVHPQGWCVLSRNTSSDEQTEEGSPAAVKQQEELAKPPAPPPPPPPPPPAPEPVAAPLSSFLIRYSTTAENGLYYNSQTGAVHIGNLEFRVASGSSTSPDPTSLEALVQSAVSEIRFQIPVEPSYVVLSGSDSSSDSEDGLSPTVAAARRVVVQNIPRLLFYKEEPNVGRGYIKELCFSADGRLVCSPYNMGVRLLAFSPRCPEMADAVPDSPTQLHEVGRLSSHANFVVSTKFSPTHCLLVSGCLNGKICFHQPIL